MVFQGTVQGGKRALTTFSSNMLTIKTYIIITIIQYCFSALSVA